MRLIITFGLIFLPLLLLSADNQSATQACIRMPNEIFFRIIENLVPNLLSPTHPEEITHHDKKLLNLKSVCQQWKTWLDQRIDFKKMESLFVGKYHWPSYQFVTAYLERFKTESYAPEQSFYAAEKTQVQCYRNICAKIEERKISETFNIECEQLMNRGFYTPFYRLLPTEQSFLWYDLYCKALLYQNEDEHRESVQVIFACHYLKYCKTVGHSIAMIEQAARFPDHVMQKARNSLKESSEDVPFDHDNCMKALFLESAPKTLFMLCQYIQKEGFLTERMYGLLRKLLSQDPAMQTLRVQSDETVKEIIKAFDLNRLLSYMLSDYLVDSSQYGTLIEQGILDFVKPTINYVTFLNSFYALYVINKARCLGLYSVRIGVFFEQYKSHFAHKDCNEKSFLDCLLLTKGDDVLAMTLLQSFIQTVGKMDDFFSKQESKFYRKQFKEKFLESINLLPQEQLSFFVNYFQMPRFNNPETASIVKSRVECIKAKRGWIFMFTFIGVVLFVCIYFIAKDSKRNPTEEFVAHPFIIRNGTYYPL